MNHGDIFRGARSAWLQRALGLGLAAWMGATQAQSAVPTAQQIEQGRALAIAADCAACHTAPKSEAPFGGGYPIDSPLGTIFSSNITPSKTAGIGDYSLEDFSRSLRQGIRRDGAHLYPAMPYTSYTRLSDADIASLYAYFMNGVKPVDTAAPQTRLPFPFDIRASMAVWNALYLDDKRFVPDAAKPAEVNRGAYLVDALEHCSACHTPRNDLMAEDSSRFLGGGSVGGWYAPNITSDPHSGIGGWSEAELVQYLRSGRVHGKAQAAGPMAEAVQNSLQHLPDEDLKAIAVYLLQTPPIATSETKPRFSYGEPAKAEAALRGLDKGIDPGWRVFSGSCAACHGAVGSGAVNGEYPSLFNNSTTGADRADNLVATILHGVDRTVDGRAHFMPAFGNAASFTDRLTDQDIADVSNYLFKQYGNPDVKVSIDDVKTIRAGGKPPLLARAQPLVVPALVIVVIVLLALLVRRARAGRRAH
jgi:mono/diheme cytochrome c family protein